MIQRLLLQATLIYLCDLLSINVPMLTIYLEPALLSLACLVSGIGGSLDVVQ
jgi:hypothetical protein